MNSELPNAIKEEIEVWGPIKIDTDAPAYEEWLEGQLMLKAMIDKHMGKGWVDSRVAKEEEEECDCGEKLLICDSGMKLCSVGCKDKWVNSKGEPVEENPVEPPIKPTTPFIPQKWSVNEKQKEVVVQCWTCGEIYADRQCRNECISMVGDYWVENEKCYKCWKEE
tara:strand:- start:107 stop:604 length:498 start_codon:yes stop_codon:yes gene_type:complete